MPNLAHHRVQDTVLFFYAFQTLAGIGAVTEQTRENYARINLHGERRSGSAPGDRVHIGAAEADVARSNQAAEIFGGQFQRWQWRLLSDLQRRHLIDGYARLNICAVGSFGVNPIEKNSGGSGMVAAIVAGASRRGHLVRQICDHHHLVLERLNRSQRPRQLEIRALAGRCPVGHHTAMRNKAHPQLNFGFAAVFDNSV